MKKHNIVFAGVMAAILLNAGAAVAASALPASGGTIGTIDATAIASKAYVDGAVDAASDAYIAADTKLEKSLTNMIAANAEDIEAINNVDTGILKQAKDYADVLDAATNQKVTANADKIGDAALPEGYADLTDAVTQLKTATTGIATDANLKTLEGRVTTAESDIEALETGKVATTDFESFKTTNTQAIADAKSGAEETAAADATTKADKALTDAKAYVDGLNTTMAERVTTAESDIEALETGKVATTDFESFKTTNTTAIEAAQAAAQKYADDNYVPVTSIDGYAACAEGAESGVCVWGYNNATKKFGWMSVTEPLAEQATPTEQSEA